MLISRNRSKLINLILFYSQNVDYCGKIKLFKLLYFTDFEHYKQTGRSVTGMEYFAWKMGPVPKVLMDEIDTPNQDLATAVKFTKKKIKNGFMLSISPLMEFDKSHFSKRELRLIDGFANQYRQTKADDMVEATHLENLPWHQIYNVQNQKQKVIPYELSFRKQEKQEMQRIAADRNELIRAYI